MIAESSLLIRSLSSAMSKILLAFLFCARPMTVEDIASQTGLNDRHTIYHACKDLADPVYGLLVKQTGEHGRDVWIPAGSLLPMMHNSFFARPDGGNSTIWPEIGQVPEIQMVEKPPSENENDCQKRDLAPENEQKSVQMVEIPPSEQGSSITMMIDDESLINQDSSSIMNLPSVATLLGNMEILFGSSLDPRDVPPDSPPKLVLAWICKAYQDRHNLKSPLGLLRVRLAKHIPRSLSKKWREILPDEFLIAIGMQEKRPAAEAIPDAQDEVVEETLAGDPRVIQAWENMLRILEPEMPRSSFARLRDVRSVEFDADSGVFLVRVRDKSLEWLENWLGSMISRILCGILDQEVKMQFLEEE